MGRERRREPRYDVEVKVEVFRDERLVAELTTRNVSASGLFLFYPKGAPLGDVLALKLSLGDQGSVTLIGEVVHSIPEVGMGIRFFDVDEASRETLDAFLARAR